MVSDYSTLYEPLERVGGYLSTIHDAVDALSGGYKELSQDERYTLRETVIAAATYTASAVAGYPLLGPIVYGIYHEIKSGSPESIEGMVRSLYEKLGGLSKSSEEQPKEQETKYTPKESMAQASIIGLSILGIGFSSRLGIEFTGKTGAILSLSLPVMLAFSFILLSSIFYVLNKKKKRN